MTILIKLGGSLITDKRTPRAFRRDMTVQVLRQLKRIRQSGDAPPLILAHGSGSFGHHEAAKYNTIAGVATEAEWLGFAKVAEAAGALSQLVHRECVALDLPVMRIPPSALIGAAGGRVVSLDAARVKRALAAGMIPLLHGDVAFDAEIGGTIIATEGIFAALAPQVDARQIILLGEVAGVLDAEGALIRSIRLDNIARYRRALAGASGADVTGGMAQKVAEMLALASEMPGMRVVIADGRRADVLVDLILNGREIGTRIDAG